MPQLYFEDFASGSVSEFGTRVVTAAEIIEFAATYDPQPMHLDPDVARESMLGAHAASGWHACCVLMRMISDGFLLRSSFLGAPGIEEVRWLAPLKAGESITVRATVLEKRVSQSRPGVGFIKFMFEIVDPAGVRVMTMAASPMFALRDAAAKAAIPQAPA